MTQFNANCGPLRFSFEWRLTLLTLTLIPLLMSLGFWQLDRAQEKQVLAQRYQQRATLPSLTNTTLQALVNTTPRDQWSQSVADRSVIVNGRVDSSRYVLIDNQTRNGRFGYDVVIFVETDEAWVPVNLGWTPGDPARRSLPAPRLTGGSRQIMGRVYLPSRPPYMLAEPLPLSSLPSVVQHFQPEAMDGPALFNSRHQILPVEIRINTDDPMALQADWPVVNQSPAKHTGYAVQWFTMSAALLLAFVFGSSNLWPLIRRRPTAP